MRKCWRNRIQAWFACALAVLALANAQADSGAPDLKHLERSFWIQASLASVGQQGYWESNFLPATAPTEAEIRNAARLLTFDYAANRLYLIYHKEIPLLEAERVFRTWRQACPPEVELVPALLLRSHDTNQTEVFSVNELRLFTAFLKRDVNPGHLAVLDDQTHRRQGKNLRALEADYTNGLIRLGLQPEEPFGAPFVAAVEDTWSGFCNGKENEEWQQPGFGREMLHKLIQSRNDGSLPTMWNLIIVARDYSKTNQDAQITYENGNRNMPLSPGRNTLAVSEIFHSATPALLGGFSSDLQMLQTNSRALTHDGTGYSFYEMLKKGHVYVGYYARPFHEVVKIYQSLRIGKMPAPTP